MKTLALLLTIASLSAIAQESTTTIEWDPNAATDGVVSYVVQYRQRGSTNAWSSLTVPASQLPVASVPSAPFQTEFRVAASNKFGLSPWSDVVFLPASVRGIRITIPVQP